MHSTGDILGDVSLRLANDARAAIDSAIMQRLSERGICKSDIPALVKEGRLVLTLVHSSGDEVYSLDGEIIFTHSGRQYVSRSGNTVTLTNYYR